MLLVPPPHRSLSFTSPFGAGKHGRRLRVVIDDQTADDGLALALLREFAVRESLEILATGDPNLPCLAIGAENREQDYIEVDFGLREQPFRTGVFGLDTWRAYARQASKEKGVTEPEAWRLLVVADACAGNDVDALVTRAPLLSERPLLALGYRAQVMDSRAALALVGLYLRAHADFTTVFDRGAAQYWWSERFYRAAAIGAMPGYPRALEDALGNWRSTQSPEVYALIDAIARRLERALRARDYILIRTRYGVREDVWGETLFFLDAFLVAVDGALDSLARAAHILYGLGPNYRMAGWRKAGWLKHLLKAAPSLTTMINRGCLLPDLAQIVGRLRNTIHGEPLSDELRGWHEGNPMTSSHMNTTLALTAEEAQELIEPAERHGGTGAWGIDGSSPPQFGVTISIDAYVEATIRALFQAVNPVLELVDLATPEAAARERGARDHLTPLPAAQENAVLLAGLGSKGEI